MVEHQPKLSSSEIAMLWGAYIEDTMSKWFLEHALEWIEDPDIRPVVESAKKTSEGHIIQVSNLFTKEGIPVPQGFTETDVNLNAPQLFSDVFHLRFIHHMSRAGVATYGVAKTTSARSDVRKMFSEWLNQTSELYDNVANVMLSKGTLVRSPMIPYPTKVEFVHDKEFLSGFFGDKRPLTALEIAHIATNIETNFVGSTLIMGFSQVAESAKIRKYMDRGKQISQKQGEIFSSILRKEDISAPATWDSAVTGSQVSPFSDKIMMFLLSTLNAVGTGNYGAAMGASMRSDLITHYSRLMIEIGQFAKDGADILIQNGWMEKPPHALKRKDLVKGN